MSSLQSKYNLLCGQKDAILNSGLFDKDEIKKLVPQLDIYIQDARSKLDQATRNIEVREAIEVASS